MLIPTCLVYAMTTQHEDHAGWGIEHVLSADGTIAV
jgi:hypothetical protein